MPNCSIFIDITWKNDGRSNSYWNRAKPLPPTATGPWNVNENLTQLSKIIKVNVHNSILNLNKEKADISFFTYIHFWSQITLDHFLFFKIVLDHSCQKVRFTCLQLFLVRFFEKDTLYTFYSSSGLQNSSCIININDFLMIIKSGEFFSALFQYIQNKQLTQQTMLIATSFWIQFNNFYQVLVLKNLILILAVFITKPWCFNTRS